ncbi:MAG: GntR family transcriptional regulator [Gammaproteobacteria bacterium RIFCSPHIGHO2_12_FULL_35_23]|nr:MAG: GntR family transcriptional regulator [Gammaproteobacteria bacterium RIFCSPHIGHO2_12_FULL_35_23]
MEFQSKKAIYLQIADYVCEQILLKKWPVSEKIPSVRELAITLEVNPNTVARTYLFLEEKTIITMQRGIGYFVSEQSIEHIIALKKEEFLSIELPQVFKTMDLLNIDLEQFKKLYDKRTKHYEKE